MNTAETDPLPIPVYTISTAALLSNILLLTVYFLCPLKNIGSYKYFFLITAIVDIIYSVAFLLLIPRVVSQYSSMILIETGIVPHKPTAYTLLIVFTTAFMCSALLVSSSFIYRYLQLCRIIQPWWELEIKMYAFRARLFEKFSSRLTVFIASSVNILVILDFFVVVSVAFYPGEEFELMISNSIRFPGIKENGAAFLGLSVKYRVSIFQLVLVADILLVLSSLGLINVFCAVKINRSLKDAAQNVNFLSLQRRMFILLQLQTANPFVCLQIPCFFAMFLLFTGIDSTPLVTNTISILLISYPVFNPIIIIAFLKEYRNFAMSKLKFKKYLKQPRPFLKSNVTRPITNSSQTVVA